MSARKSDSGDSDPSGTGKPGATAPEATGLAAFEAFSTAMLDAATKTQDLVSKALAGAEGGDDAPPADPFALGPAFATVFGQLAASPEALMRAQTALFANYGALWANTARRAEGKTAEDTISPAPGDNRWRAPEWSENLAFDMLKQSYLLNAKWLSDLIASAPDVDPATRKKAAFFTRQMTDAFAPVNFAMTNPEVLRAAVHSKGESLKQGLDNLARDLERGNGTLKISQTDTEAFSLGVDIATAPGKVMFENEIMQLLQFSPTTKTACTRPLVIFPPWINKYYILDLQPKSSMIRWLVDKGYTVFLVSWVNPDASLKDKGFEDYMRAGIFAALDAIKAATGESKVNAVGYCIGGTLLSATLAFMAAGGDKRIASATFFAAQTDFENAGDLQVFCDEAGLHEVARRMDEAGGVLDGAAMAETFNMLRANDLIWSNVISNYLLGRKPRAFDLLYWNADTTRMPKALHLYYLDMFYRRNAFAKGEMVLDGVRLDPGKVVVPLYVQAARSDHIAPCESVYRGARLFGSAKDGKVRFMLAGSGHIAGVINPPVAKKYQYWSQDTLPESFAEWQAGAVEHPGSWWPHWHTWLRARSGKRIPSRSPGDGALSPIEDAPGRYVKVKS